MEKEVQWIRTSGGGVVAVSAIREIKIRRYQADLHSVGDIAENGDRAQVIAVLGTLFDEREDFLVLFHYKGEGCYEVARSTMNRLIAKLPGLVLGESRGELIFEEMYLSEP